jgi:DNA-binding transcriptional ArsR family regulator
VAGAYIALLAVVVGGLPLAFAAARYSVTVRRWRILALLAHGELCVCHLEKALESRWPNHVTKISSARWHRCERRSIAI